MTKLIFPSNSKLFTLLFLFSFHILLSSCARVEDATSYDIENYEDLSKCTCDLTSATCDIYCCCDPDCPSVFTKLWESSTTGCLNSRPTHDVTVLAPCVSQRSLYNHNRNLGLKTYIGPVEQMTCIFYDNSPSHMGYYYKYKSSMSLEQISGQKLGDGIFANVLLDVETTPESSTGYSDYPVETETETNTDETEAETETDTTTTTDITVSGAFRVPADNGYGLCNNYNSPKFLQNSESTCTQKLPGTNCKNSFFYYEKFQSSVEVHFGQSDSSSSYALTIGTITLDGATSSLESLVILSTTDKCATGSKLIGSSFKVYINNKLEITGGEIDMSFTSADLSSLTHIEQKYSVTFLGNSGASIKSGNPGYIPGKPLLLSTGNKFVIKGIGANGCLTNNETSGDLERTVNFGEEMLLSCAVKSQELTTYCANSKLFTSLNQFTSIGIFPTALPGVSGDWKTIVQSGNLAGSLSGQTCSIPSLITYEILTAKLGFEGNLQQYVLYARRSEVQGAWTSTETVVTEDETETEETEEETEETVVTHYIYHQYVNIIFKEVKESDLKIEDKKDYPSFFPEISDDVFYPFQMQGNFAASNHINLAMLLLLVFVWIFL